MTVRDMDLPVLKGTTTLALKCNNGVILATDTRATMLPGFVAHKAVKKVYKITRNIGMTIAGVPADAQNLLDLLRANAALYELQRKRIIPVRSVAGLASNIMFSRRFYPYMTQTLIGGCDTEGYHVFSLDPLGSVIEDSMVATGSGSPIAYGVLENEYKDGMTLKEALPVAVRAITAAMKRNVYTGDDFNIALITKEKGYTELSREEKKEILKRSSLKTSI